MSSCSRCNNETPAKFLVTCDSCKSKSCLKCTRLSSTELRAVALKTRIMKYFCERCDSDPRSEVLRDGVEDVTSGVNIAEAENTLLALDVLMQPFLDKLSRLELEVRALKESNVELIKMLTKRPDMIVGVDGIAGKDSDVGCNKTGGVAAGATLCSSGGNKVKLTLHDDYRSENKANRRTSNRGAAQHAATTGGVPANQKVLDGVARDDDGFLPVLSRKGKRQRRRNTLGTAQVVATEAEGNFQGRQVDRKAWLFVSRVRDGVTEQTIRSYIKRKIDTASDEDIVVKALETRYDRKDSNCFQVGVNFDFKDKLYDKEFWPSGVAFRRFRFHFSKPGNFQILASETA